MLTILDRLLAPIARLAVARGVPFPQLVDRLKLSYVRGAEQLAGGTKPATDSRISVMTGLQRRDIARLRTSAGSGADTLPVTHLARLVAAWQTEHRGQPLPRSGKVSFDALAMSIRKDVHPRTLLEQLIAAGTVAEAGQEVRLLAPSYQPLPGSDDQLAYLAANGGDHLRAAVENILSDPAPFLERAVHYNNLSPEAVAQLDKMFTSKAMALLHDMNAEAARLQQHDPGTHRFRSGAYFYSEDEAE